MTLSNNYNSAPVRSFNNSIDASEIEEEETKVNTNINMFGGGGGNRFTQQSSTTPTRSQSPPKLPSSRPPLPSTRSTSNIPTSNNSNQQQLPNVTSKIQQLQSQFNSKPSPINNAQSKYAPNNSNNNIPIGGGGGGRTPPPPPSKSRPQLPTHANSVPNNLGSNIVNNNNNNNNSSIPNIQLQTTLQPISQTPLSNINSQSSSSTQQPSPSSSGSGGGGGGGGTIGGFMKKISEKLGSEKVDEVYDGEDDLENNVTPEDITAPDGFIPTGFYIFYKSLIFFGNINRNSW